MRVFLTGGTGYIGSAVAERLQRDGHEIHGLARSEESAPLLKSRNIHPVLGVLNDAGVLTTAASQSDAVIQAAFALGADVDGSVKAERASIEALMAGVQGTSKPLIVTSGSAVLGDTGSIVYAEDTPIPPHPFRRRFETEQMVLNDRSVHGIFLRPPNVYGHGNGRAILSLLQSVASKFGGVPYGKGTADHLWSFVHIQDLGELFALAIAQSPRGELFHAGAQSGLRTHSIAEAVSEAAGFDGRTVELEREALRSAFSAPALAGYWATNNQSSRDKAEQLLHCLPGTLTCSGRSRNHSTPPEKTQRQTSQRSKT